MKLSLVERATAVLLFPLLLPVLYFGRQTYGGFGKAILYYLKVVLKG